MTEAQLRAQLATLGLPSLTNTVLRLSRPAIRLHPDGRPDDRIDIGVSKFGGSPDMPLSMPWPAWRDRPLGFVAQVNLTEIAPYAPATGILPTSGELYFFYDLWEQPWGFDPKDRGGAKVIYVDGAAAQFQRRSAPPSTYNTVDPAPITASAITYSLDLSPRSAQSEQLDLLVPDRDMRERYSEWWFDPSTECLPVHQLLGLPALVQGDMEIECQFASNGVYVGDTKALHDRRHEHMKASAVDWELLLQVDSDDTLGTMWGDSGRIYFWIRRQDLAARNFEQTWLILQCG